MKSKLKQQMQALKNKRMVAMSRKLTEQTESLLPKKKSLPLMRKLNQIPCKTLKKRRRMSQVAYHQLIFVYLTRIRELK